MSFVWLIRTDWIHLARESNVLFITKLSEKYINKFQYLGVINSTAANRDNVEPLVLIESRKLMFAEEYKTVKRLCKLSIY